MSDATTKDMGMEERNGAGGLKRWIPLLVIAAGALTAFFTLGDYLNLETLRDNREALIAWRDENLVLAGAVFMAIYMAVVAFSIPGALWMTLTGGFLFGVVAGSLMTVFAATVGATAIFLAARSSLGESLRERAGPWMKKLEAGFQENEASYMLLLRLVPAVPFFIANLAPAFLGVRLSTYLWTTFVGIMPATAIYTWVGAGLGEVIDQGGEPNLSLIAEPHVLGPLLGLAALAALPILIKALRNKRGQ
ncbi:MAG: TVP38/TMEM64 family protein [Pseudomonadota bacterium]